jgi:hypothetical protein
MILTVSLWVILIAVCAMVGATILQWVQAGQFARPGDRFIVASWLGLVTLAVLLLAVSLALPLSPLIGVAVAGAGVIVSLAHRGTREELKRFSAALSPRLLLGALVLAIGVAAYTAQPVQVDDTGLYHFGMSKWLGEHGAVPGLALIHLRFGLASSWFAAAAPFNAGLLEDRTATLLEGLVLLLAGFHLLLCASRCLTNRARLSDWFVVFASALLIPINIYWGAFVSLSPDVPVTILTLIVAWTIVLITEAPPLKEKTKSLTFDASIIPFILSAAAMTIKLNALSLILISALFYLYRKRFNPRSVLALGAIGLVIIAPMIGYQIIASGCPMFPTGLMCLDVPWAVRPEEARSFTELILAWSRWNGPPPADANSFNWLWREWIFAGTTSKSLLLILASTIFLAAGFVARRFTGILKLLGRWLVALGIVALAFLLMTRASNLLIVCVLILALATYRRQFAGKNWLLAIGLLGTALMIYGAPSLRFGVGYIAILLACFAVAHHEALDRAARSITLRLTEYKPALLRQTTTVLALLLAAGGLTIGLYRVVARTPAPRSETIARAEDSRFPFLMPPRIYSAKVARLRLNDFDYYRPIESDQCWGTQLPCVAEDPRADIMLREPARGIAAGFRRGVR